MTTQAPQDVKPLCAPSSRLGPKECKKRKTNVFIIHLVTVGFTFLTIYLGIEFQQFKINIQKQLGQQVPFSQFIILIGLLLAFNIVIIIYSFAYSSNVKRSKDMKCYNQIQGMKPIFAASIVIAAGSAWFIQRESEAKYAVLLKVLSVVVLCGAVGLEYIFVDK